MGEVMARNELKLLLSLPLKVRHVCGHVSGPIRYQRSTSENLFSAPIFKLIISVLVKTSVLLTVLAAFRQISSYLNVYTRLAMSFILRFTFTGVVK